MRRYEFYFKRYNNHEHSERKAKEVKNVVELKMQLLVEDHSFEEHEVKFLSEAFE